MIANGICAGHFVSICLDIVYMYSECEFRIDFVCMDGASINRSFINSICDSLQSVATDITSIDHKISCIIDFSHVIKNVRKSLSSSGENRKKIENITPDSILY